jgi:hypothetical protein
MARKRKSGGGVLSWLPLVIGIIITPVALRSASVLAVAGTDGLTALFPWAQVFRASILHLPIDIAASTSQLMMYLQFPLYGLVMVWQRERGTFIGLGAVAFLHVFGAILAIVLMHMSNPSLRFY